METLCEAENKASSFIPPVQLTSNEEERLVAKVDLAVAAQLEVKMEEKWQKQRKDAPSFLQATLPEEPPESLVKEHFVQVLRAICNKSTQGFSFEPEVQPRTEDDRSLLKEVVCDHRMLIKRLKSSHTHGIGTGSSRMTSSLSSNESNIT